MKPQPWWRVPADRLDESRMKLGRQAPFYSGYSKLADIQHYSSGGFWASRPFARMLDRIDIRMRYRPGPKPFAPGRYTTARWQPYSGSGRFSGVREAMQGAYYAERYSGVCRRPEHYIRDRTTPEKYAAEQEARWRRQSWTVRKAA